MKTSSFYLKSFLAFYAFILIFSCSSEPEMSDNSLGELVNRNGTMPIPNESRDTSIVGVVNNVEDGIEWQCTTETLSIEDGAGGNSGYATYSPNSEVIYPGNMLQGKSLQQGTPDIIAVDRAGGTISIDINDGNSNSSQSIDEITTSGVSQGINNIIAGSSGILPANFKINISSVQSQEEFAFALGLDLNTTFYDVSADLKYNSQSKKNKFLVNLNQSYYTISYDIPTSLDDLFAPTVTADDLSKYMGPGNPATYISSVTYGRVYYMLIESSSSRQEMEASINASFNGVALQAEAEVDVSYMSDLEELTINVFAYGGDAVPTLLTAGNSDISKLTNLLAQASVIESGKPLSYVVRSVYDNQIVATQLATTYDITNCIPVGANGAPPYVEHWTGNVVSQMGPVGAAYNTTGTEFILINKDGNQYMVSNTGVLDGPFPINEISTAPLPFNGIGAACKIDGNNGNFETVMFTDLSGTQNSYLLGNGTWGPLEPSANFANGENPFGLEGFGAIAFHSVDSDLNSRRVIFNKEGTKYSQFYNGTNTFSNVFDLYDWGTPDGQVSEKIFSVGASIGFDLGNRNFKILFDGAGTKYVIYGDISGTGIRTIGPFSL